MGNKPVFERVHVVFQETGAATSIEPECVRGKVFGNERGVSFGLCGPRCSAKGNLDRLGLRQRHNAASTYHSRGPLSSLFSLPRNRLYLCAAIQLRDKESRSEGQL